MYPFWVGPCIIYNRHSLQHVGFTTWPFESWQLQQISTEKSILKDVLHFSSLAVNQKASGLSAHPWWRLIVTGSNAWPGYVNGGCSSVASFEGKDKFYAVAKEEIGHCRVKQAFRKRPWIKVCGSISGHRWRKMCIIGFRSGVHDVLLETIQRTKSITHTWTRPWPALGV